MIPRVIPYDSELYTITTLLDIRLKSRIPHKEVSSPV